MVLRAVVIASSAATGENGRSALPAALSNVAEQASLVPVANRPFLFHVLDSLERAGVTHATLVTDRRDRAVVAGAVATADEWELELDLSARTPARGAYAAISDAAAASDDTPVLVHFGDALGELPLAPADTELGPGDAVVLTASRRGEPASPSFAGAVLMGAEAARMAATLADGAEAEAALVQLLDRLAGRGGRVERRIAGEWWRCRHDAESLLEGNAFVLEALTPAPVAVGNGNRISGKVAIHRSATVESSVIRGPVVVGERACVRNAYLGPCTSIGPDADIEGAEIEHSIVFGGARISHLGSRLEGSVIGPRAQVFRDFRLPRALRLEVGGEAQVALS